MSRNKLIKFKELRNFEHVIEVSYDSIKNNDFRLKGKWGVDYFNNDHPVILELGCGKGEFSVEMAEKFPEKNFLGIDIKGDRLWTGAISATEKKLNNIGFLRTFIENIGQFFGPEEVSEIWLTFPDPQMKKSRKRLTSTTFLNKYRNFLKKDGIVHLKTDSYFQFSYTNALARTNGFEIIAETENIYGSEILNEPLQIKTYYENQWLSRGIPIKYLAFRLNDKVFHEPEKRLTKDNYRSFGRMARM